MKGLNSRMKFIGKRILVVCKETYSYPLFYLVKEWKCNNEIAAFFINPCETRYNKCYLNDTTYYKFLQLGIPVFTCNDIADKFTKNLNNTNVDYSGLKKFEEKYSHYKNFNQQILSTQYFTKHYHFRNYMCKTTYEQQMHWLELNYVCAEKILDDFQPDIIIDTDCAELGRTVLAEIAYNRAIPYLTLEYPRFELYKTISFQAGYGVDEYFVREYERACNLSKEELKEEIEYINRFREKTKIMSKEYAGDITSSYDVMGMIPLLKRMFGVISYFFNQDYIAKNISLKKMNPILYPNSIEYLKYYWNYYRRRNKLLRSNKYFYIPKKAEKYVYMPLHLIPESSTFTKAPFYINELDIISAVSKALPIGWKLYVKEHQAMIGEREEWFYEAVNRIPNVAMVQINYYKDPKPWIENSQGVVTITGTSAYEAALMGKRALVFGDVMFGQIEGVTRVKSFEELPQLLKSFNGDEKINNIESCAAYIRAVKMVGKSINIKLLLNDGLKYLRKNNEPSCDYLKELEALKDLFEHNFDIYNKYK